MTLQKVKNNFTWLLSDRLIQIFFNLLINAWIARVLGLEDFGRVATCLAIIALVEPICDLSIRTLVVVKITQNEERQVKVLTNTFILSFASCLCVSAILISSSNSFIADSSLKTVLTIFASFLPFKATLFAEYFLESKTKGKYIFKAKKIAFALSFLLKVIVMVFSGGDLYLLSLAIGIETFFYSFLIYKIAKDEDCPNINLSEISLNEIQSLLSQTYPLILAAIASAITLKIGQVILPLLTNESTAGNYAIAQKFVDIFCFLPIIITQSSFPSILKRMRGGKDNALYDLLRLGTLLTYLGIVLSALIVLTGPYLLNLLYGEQFSVASKIVGINCLSLPFIFSFSLRKKLLIATSKSKYVLVLGLMTGIMAIAFTWVLTMRLGIYGAALSGPLVWLISVVALPVLFNRRSDVYFFFKTTNPFNLLNHPS